MASSGLIEAVRQRAKNPATRTDQTDVYLPDIQPTLSDNEISNIESEVGLKLPNTLIEIYTSIGDGGFGPGYGFLRMRIPDSQGDSIVNLHRVLSSPDPNDPSWDWPEQLLLFCDWGCAIRSGVDCATEQMTVFDPNLHESNWTDCFIGLGYSLDDWLRRWCEGHDLWEEIYGDAEREY